jgi:hypothetical protein
MKFRSSGSIAKGMLPLLDISLLLFGIMIIVLTFVRINQPEPPGEDTSQPFVNIMLPGEDDPTSKEAYQVNKDVLVENVIKKLNEEGRLLFLRFDVMGEVNYMGKLLYDGEFYTNIKQLLLEIIEKNNPLVVIAYPDTGNKPNKATYQRVKTLKEDISKYSEMVTEISYIPEELD